MKLLQGYETVLKKSKPEEFRKIITTIMRCPHCNESLTDLQIDLKQMGKEVLCHNCLKFIKK